MGEQTGEFLGGKNNWISQSSGTTNHLLGVSFTDVNTGTAVGYNGTILRTTNGGASWIRQSSGTTESLSCVFFIDANTGTTVGNNAIILRTTNSGSSWTNQSSGTTMYLRSVSFTDANTGTAVGYIGTILRTYTGGVTDVKEDFISINSSDFRLMQNYPNPFNPSTTINYQLPTQSHVTLKVFDVLGREVATLVNTVEQPGYKTVKFDASGLSSGLYFYRLQAGNYVETKKLVLLR